MLTPSFSLRIAAMALACGILSPTTVAAQEPFGGLQSHGHLALGYSGRVPGADAFLFSDATLRLSAQSLGWAVPLGLELGVFGLADARDTPHETYATLTWDMGGGARLSAGVPRPAYDGFAVSGFEGAFPSLGVARTGTTRSSATFGAMFANALPLGARFENRAGALHYAVSAHHASNVDRTIAGLGVEWTTGPWQLSGGIEASWGARNTRVAAKAQAIRGFGAWALGVGYYIPGIAGGPDLMEAFGTFAPTDRLDLIGLVQVPATGGAATAGISARYSLRPGTALSLGVLDPGGGEPSLGASVDFAF